MMDRAGILTCSCSLKTHSTSGRFSSYCWADPTRPDADSRCNHSHAWPTEISRFNQSLWVQMHSGHSIIRWSTTVSKSKPAWSFPLSSNDRAGFFGCRGSLHEKPANIKGKRNKRNIPTMAENPSKSASLDTKSCCKPRPKGPIHASLLGLYDRAECNGTADGQVTPVNQPNTERLIDVWHFLSAHPTPLAMKPNSWMFQTGHNDLANKQWHAEKMATGRLLFV